MNRYALDTRWHAAVERLAWLGSGIAPCQDGPSAGLGWISLQRYEAALWHTTGIPEPDCWFASGEFTSGSEPLKAHPPSLPQVTIAVWEHHS